MIKQFIIIAMGGIVILSGCKKETGVMGAPDNSTAYVSFTNVNANAKTVNVFVDDSLINRASPIAVNATVLGTYVGVYPGEHILEVKDNTAPGAYYNNNNIIVSGGKAYSYYLYDTLSLGRFKGILLTSDRNINPASANSKIRFLNLSPKSPLLDVWFIRRVGAVAKDSLKIFAAVRSLSAVASPDPVALSAYTNVASSQAAGAAGTGSLVTDYIIRLKIANTTTILASTAATTLVNGRTYTFFARGIYPAIGISSMLNN